MAPEHESLSAEPEMEPPRRLNILGCRVDQVDQASTLNRLTAMLAEPRPHLIVTADASMLVRAQSDSELHGIIHSADLVLPDSIGVVLASRLLGTPLSERVTGVELVDHLCGICARRELSVYLVGSAPGISERAGESLKTRHPGLVVAGAHHGYFTEAEEPQVLAAIREAAPHVLLVAMGIPRQEKWLSRHLPALPVRVGVGVGGSLDVAAGEVKRAPSIVQRYHLEWLYRVLKEPRRYRKTLLLPQFVWLTLLFRLRIRRRDTAPS